MRDDRDVIESWHYWGHPAVISASRTRHSWHCIKLLIYTLIFHSICTPQTVEVLQAINETPRLFIFMARKHRDMSRSDTHILGKYLYFAAHRFKTSAVFVCYLSLKPPNFSGHERNSDLWDIKQQRNTRELISCLARRSWVGLRPSDWAKCPGETWTGESVNV